MRFTAGTRLRRSPILRAFAFAAVLGGAFPGSAADESRTKLLTRSIYVPVVFSIAQGLREVLLSIEGEERPFPPSPRVFLFTYYPEHEKFLPESVEVRVSARGECSDEPVKSRFLVTPYGIYAASGSLPYDEEGVGRLLKTRRRDVRLKAKVVRIGCHAETAGEAPSAGEDESRSAVQRLFR